MRPVVTPGGQTHRPRAAGAPGPAGAAGAGHAARGSTRGRSGSGRVVGDDRPPPGPRRRRRLSLRARPGPAVQRRRAAPGRGARLRQARLDTLAADPPGLYAEVADPAGDLEERTWLAFLIAYLGPLDGDAPVRRRSTRCAPPGPRASRPTSTTSPPARAPSHDAGPRHAHARGLPRLGARVRLAGGRVRRRRGVDAGAAVRPRVRAARRCPGLIAAPRFDLLATLGRLGVYELQAGALGLRRHRPVTAGRQAACSGSATRCCSSAAPPSWPPPASSRWRRSTSAFQLGARHRAPPRRWSRRAAGCDRRRPCRPRSAALSDSRRRRCYLAFRTMLALLLLVLWPIAELFVAIKVAEAIGVLLTVLLLVAGWPVGSGCLRSEGRAAWRRLSAAIAAGRPPGREVIDGALVAGRRGAADHPRFHHRRRRRSACCSRRRARSPRALIAAQLPQPVGGPGRARFGAAPRSDYDVDSTASRRRPAALHG